jgi:hypothetical protein
MKTVGELLFKRDKLINANRGHLSEALMPPLESELLVAFQQHSMFTNRRDECNKRIAVSALLNDENILASEIMRNELGMLGATPNHETYAVFKDVLKELFDEGSALSKINERNISREEQARTALHLYHRLAQKKGVEDDIYAAPIFKWKNLLEKQGLLPQIIDVNSLPSRQFPIVIVCDIRIENHMKTQKDDDDSWRRFLSLSLTRFRFLTALCLTSRNARLYELKLSLIVSGSESQSEQAVF